MITIRTYNDAGQAEFFRGSLAQAGVNAVVAVPSADENHAGADKFNLDVNDEDADKARSVLSMIENGMGM